LNAYLSSRSGADSVKLSQVSGQHFPAGQGCFICYNTAPCPGGIKDICTTGNHSPAINSIKNHANPTKTQLSL
jgi:hypothetical protein